MKVLIFHGYLLRGTGSNVYNANVAQALARLGHEVHLLCQDLEAASLPWIDAVGRWEGGLAVEATGNPGSEGDGAITAYTPDVGGLLPVYVADRYEGFESRTFSNLSDDEIESYIAANVAAIADVAAYAGGIDAALANHLVMGPVILARSGLPYAAKIHGSALSYTVIPEPERFGPYAREGMESARAVLCGSRHTAASLWETLDLEGLEEKTRLGPPGVDVEAFSPLEDRADAPAELNALATEIEAAAPAAGSPSLGRDPEAATAALRSYAAADGHRVIFVGKLIVSKGLDLLLAAWPLVEREHPGSRLLLIGFGEYRDTLLRLWDALARGDLDVARDIASRGRALEGGEESELTYLQAFLDELPSDYAEAAAAAADTVDLAGRLEYAEVARAVRASDALVVPSTFPEAFGMVAAEAAAAGALPVCARHSGLAEVAGTLTAALGDSPAADLTAFDLGSEAVEGIAANLNDWLALAPAARADASAAMVAEVRARWSWEGVARSVLAASAGDLAALDPISPA